MKRVLVFFMVTISSCVLLTPGNLTDNAFYDLDDASIRLVVKHDKDTLYKTAYEQNNNLNGKYYTLLSTTNQIDTTHKLGVQLKVWAKIVLNEKGTYYGAFPKNGLLDKIDTIKISFTNGESSFDITPFLKGDSAIYEFKWRTCAYKKTPYTWGNSPYFKNTNELKDALNGNNNMELKRIPDNDYIFWLDRKTMRALTFKPTLLQLKISLVDSTGTKHRQLTDFIKMN